MHCIYLNSWYEGGFGFLAYILMPASPSNSTIPKSSVTDLYFELNETIYLVKMNAPVYSLNWKRKQGRSLGKWITWHLLLIFLFPAVVNPITWQNISIFRVFKKHLLRLRCHFNDKNSKHSKWFICISVRVCVCVCQPNIESMTCLSMRNSIDRIFVVNTYTACHLLSVFQFISFAFYTVKYKSSFPLLFACSLFFIKA